jgi:hypothetical protein
MVYFTEAFNAVVNENTGASDFKVTISSTPIPGLKWYFERDFWDLWWNPHDNQKSNMLKFTKKNREKHTNFGRFFGKFNRMDKE